MRLTREQIRLIIQTVSRLGSGPAEVYLFGSRLDDHARGGDIDLLVVGDTALGLIDRARLKLELETSIGVPVDIVAQGRDELPTPFQTIARSRAVRLEARA